VPDKPVSKSGKDGGTTSVKGKEGGAAPAAAEKGSDKAAEKERKERAKRSSLLRSAAKLGGQLGKELASRLGRAPRPRLPPSSADPSTLANTPLLSEDDVLHLKNLPEFNGALRTADVEVLLQVCCSRPQRSLFCSHAPFSHRLPHLLFTPRIHTPAAGLPVPSPLSLVLHAVLTTPAP
jgi:hypothetical protein